MFAEGTRSRDGSIGRCAPARRSSPPSTASRWCRSTSRLARGDAGRPLLAEVPAAAPKRRRLELDFGAPIRPPDASTAARSWSVCASSSSRLRWAASSSPAPAASSAARSPHGCGSAATTSSGSRAPTRASRWWPSAGSGWCAATCSTRSRWWRGWRAATSSTTGRHQQPLPPGPGAAAARQRGGPETRRAGGGAGGRQARRLHVVGRLGGGGARDGRPRGLRPPRLLPVGLRPLQARGRAGGVRRRPPLRRRGGGDLPVLGPGPGPQHRQRQADHRLRQRQAAGLRRHLPERGRHRRHAEAHVLAAERGRAGARYVLNGATITSSEALELVAEVSGVEPTLRIVPPPIARVGRRALEAAYGCAAACRRCAARASARSCTATGTTARSPSASSGSTTRRSRRRSAARSTGPRRRIGRR